MTDATANEAVAPAKTKDPVAPIWTQQTALAALALAFIIALGDVLFFRSEPGISLAIFLLAIGIAVVALHRDAWRDWRTPVYGAVALIGIAPLAETASFFGFCCGVGAVSLLALQVSGLLPRFEDWFGTFVRFGILAPARVIGDGFQLLWEAGERKLGGRIVRQALVWIVPVVCALVFLWLFVAANPVLEEWVKAVRIDALLTADNVWHVILWGMIAVFAWPLLMPKLLRWVPLPEVQGPVQPPAESLVFGAAAIRNSLVVFNAMFAVQTAMDLMYLWGGIRLPDGLTYADYAHHAAYPLIITAVLAAAFVLAAMRKNGPGRDSPLIRTLVYLWIGQNVWLVISAILRLKLYVEVYMLSELRIAAGVWMVLVAVGLVLILAGILFERSNKWLVMSNLVAAALAFYGVALLDSPSTIAWFNVTHSWQMEGTSEVSLDSAYLGDLGPGVIPALDHLLAHEQVAETDDTKTLRLMRENMALNFSSRPPDWQSWTWRGERLRQYLKEHPYAPDGIDTNR
jgi:hypothetical protein